MVENRLFRLVILVLRHVYDLFQMFVVQTTSLTETFITYLVTFL